MFHAQWRLLASTLAVGTLLMSPASADSKLDSLVAAAKAERDLTIIGGGTLFGGSEGFAELEGAFNKRFGLNARLRLVTGPNMSSMAGRLLTEIKGNRAPSSDVYIGTTGQFVQLERENALESTDWSGIFPWVTPQMQVHGPIGVTVGTSMMGMLYNPALLPPDQAPKTHFDMIDPTKNAAWRGRLAVPIYAGWAAVLSLTWGEDRARGFVKQLSAGAAGYVRYSEVEPLVSGQFNLYANQTGVLELVEEWEKRGVKLTAVLGENPVSTYYFMLGIPRKTARPNLARLFIAFMASPEGQAISERRGSYASAFVPSTKIANYVSENKIVLQDPQGMYEFYKSGRGDALSDEFDAMLRR